MRFHKISRALFEPRAYGRTPHHLALVWYAGEVDIISIKLDLEDLLGFDADVATKDAISPYIRRQSLRKLSAYAGHLTAPFLGSKFDKVGV
jgi:hypothetical protein